MWRLCDTPVTKMFVSNFGKCNGNVTQTLHKRKNYCNKNMKQKQITKINGLIPLFKNFMFEKITQKFNFRNN